MNGTPLKIILTGEDALRTQYVPPEPSVKILKRPPKNAPVVDNKSVQPKKTLQQREKEYAQARLRILGEAQSSDKVEDKYVSIFTSGTAYNTCFLGYVAYKESSLLFGRQTAIM